MWYFDCSKGLETVAAIRKYKASPKMMVLQLVIAILLKLVDEGRSAKRLKTSLINFAHCCQSQIGCLATGNYNDRWLLKHNPEAASVMIARFFARLPAIFTN